MVNFVLRPYSSAVNCRQPRELIFVRGKFKFMFILLRCKFPWERTVYVFRVKCMQYCVDTNGYNRFATSTFSQMFRLFARAPCGRNKKKVFFYFHEWVRTQSYLKLLSTYKMVSTILFYMLVYSIAIDSYFLRLYTSMHKG